MSASIYFNRDGGRQCIFLAGSSEIENRWLPIIQNHQLGCLEVVFSAGISIDAGVHAQLLHELAVIQRELEAALPFEGVVSRIHRLLEFLRSNEPNEALGLYIG
ncbi:hypothetical protein NA78x_002516 [Anatilimnocola sp. NA78]|uniref:hypothetical protein n=1 Tax=Anatilimnocola sp. NA78 TaxID=3415683 RepID=UPI003CE56B7D